MVAVVAGTKFYYYFQGILQKIGTNGLKGRWSSRCSVANQQSWCKHEQRCSPKCWSRWRKANVLRLTMKHDLCFVVWVFYHASMMCIHHWKSSLIKIFWGLQWVTFHNPGLYCTRTISLIMVLYISFIILHGFLFTPNGRIFFPIIVSAGLNNLHLTKFFSEAVSNVCLCGSIELLQ